MHAPLLFLVLSTPLFALPPDSIPSPLESSAESPALQSRLRRPWNQFLLDGQTSYAVGDLFYADKRFSSEERFSLMPEFQVIPDLSENDSTRAALALYGGEELRDNLFGDNQAPYFRGKTQVRVAEHGHLALEGEQNDLYSQENYPRRALVLGNVKSVDASWLGANLPAESFWRAGGKLTRRGGTAQVGHARGFIWGRSNLTGESYPLEANGTEALVGSEDGLRLRFRAYEYNGLSDRAAYAPKASFSDVGLATGGEGGDWNYGMEWSYRKRLVERGSAWRPMDRISYPWAFHGGKGWKDDDSLWKIKTGLAWEYDEGVLTSKVMAKAGENWRKHFFTQEMRGYHRHPFGDSDYIAETTAGFPTPGAGYQVPRLARGGGAVIGYVFRDSLWEAGVSGAGTLEWGTPVFSGTSQRPLGQPEDFWLSRSGEYRGSDYMLGRWQSSFFVEGCVGNRLRLKATGGWQMFTGEEADRLEFLPAPFYAEVQGKLKLFTGLGLEARVQAMAAKQYNGFGISMRVPPHLENGMAVEQMAFGDKLRLRWALFQAFCDGFSEHPLGNPVKLRMAASAAYAFR